jgi:hypothetical protein
MGPSHVVVLEPLSQDAEGRQKPIRIVHTLARCGAAKVLPPGLDQLLPSYNLSTRSMRCKVTPLLVRCGGR